MHGLLWWRAQLARFLFRPLPGLLALGLQGTWGGLRGHGTGGREEEASRHSSYVGVHVRRGDKVSEVPLLPVESFAAAAAAISGSTSRDDAGEWAGYGIALGVGGGRGDVAHLPTWVVSDDAPAARTVTALIQGLQGSSGTQAPRNASASPLAASHDAQGADNGEFMTSVPQSRSGHLVRDFDGVDIASMTASAVLDLWFSHSPDPLPTPFLLRSSYSLLRVPPHYFRSLSPCHPLARHSPASKEPLRLHSAGNVSFGGRERAPFRTCWCGAEGQLAPRTLDITQRQPADRMLSQYAHIDTHTNTQGLVEGTSASTHVVLQLRSSRI